MKKIILSLLFCPFILCGQNTNIIYINSGYQLLVGQECSLTTTNSVGPVTNTFGYLFNTNDTTYVAWQFPAQIINGTNCVISLYQINTNTNIINFSVVVESYNSTNGLIYRTNNVISGGLVNSTSTNFTSYTFTNIWPTNALNYNTNTSYGYIKFTHTPTNVNGPNAWFLGGKITYRNN